MSSIAGDYDGGWPLPIREAPMRLLLRLMSERRAFRRADREHFAYYGLSLVRELTTMSAEDTPPAPPRAHTGAVRPPRHRAIPGIFATSLILSRAARPADAQIITSYRKAPRSRR